MGVSASVPIRASRTSTAALSYRFNLERDQKSRHDIQAAGATGPHDHTYLSLGSFYHAGKLAAAVRRAIADALRSRMREPYYRVGGDFNFNYRTFNVYGVYM